MKKIKMSSWLKAIVFQMDSNVLMSLFMRFLDAVDDFNNSEDINGKLLNLLKYVHIDEF